MPCFHFFIIEWHMSWWEQIHVNAYLLLMWDVIAKKDDHSITSENLPWDVHDIQSSSRTEQFHSSELFNQIDFFPSHPHQILRYGLLTNHRGRAFLTIYLNLLSSLKQDNIGIFISTTYISMSPSQINAIRVIDFFLQKLFCVSIKNMK